MHSFNGSTHSIEERILSLWLHADKTFMLQSHRPDLDLTQTLASSPLNLRRANEDREPKNTRAVRHLRCPDAAEVRAGGAGDSRG